MAERKQTQKPPPVPTAHTVEFLLDVFSNNFSTGNSTAAEADRGRRFVHVREKLGGSSAQG